jgi:hypothetical protein
MTLLIRHPTVIFLWSTSSTLFRRFVWILDFDQALYVVVDMPIKRIQYRNVSLTC